MPSQIRDHKRYEQVVERFQRDARCYFAAPSLDGKHNVAAHEIGTHEAEKGVKMPDVCKCLKIKGISPFGMLKTEKRG